MKTYNVQMKSEDSYKLQNLHYQVEGLLNLLNRFKLNDAEDKVLLKDYTDQYINTFREYSEFKDYCTQTYIPSECNANNTSWTADFEHNSLVFTEV